MSSVFRVFGRQAHNTLEDSHSIMTQFLLETHTMFYSASIAYILRTANVENPMVCRGIGNTTGALAYR